jgi:hypothetical protein
MDRQVIQHKNEEEANILCHLKEPIMQTELNLSLLVPPWDTMCEVWKEGRKKGRGRNWCVDTHMCTHAQRNIIFKVHSLLVVRTEGT